MPAFAPISGLPVASVPSSGLSATVTVPCTGRASRMMNARVSTFRRIETQSAATKGLVPSWVENIASVCAALQVDSSFESMQDMRETGEIRLRCYTPSGADIRTTDAVLPLTGVYAGQWFAVESIGADDAGHEAYSKFRLRRVAGGRTR